jgi:hypothetical protein
MFNKDELDAWKKHPVSKKLLSTLENEKDYLAQYVLSGGLMQSTIVEREYGRAVGRMDTISQILSDAIFETETKVEESE